MIISEEIARLRELEKKATPRPWFLAVHEEKTVKKLMEWTAKLGMHYPDNKTIHMVGAGKFGEDGLDEDEIRVPAVTGNGPTSEANRDYICAARNVLPDLLDEIERLQAAGFIEVERANKAEADLAAALKRAEALQEALVEISWGEGAFSRDPLTHAGNTIENMKSIARTALSGG